MAPAPYQQAAKPAPKKAVNVLIEKRPKNFGIGKLMLNYDYLELSLFLNLPGSS